MLKYFGFSKVLQSVVSNTVATINLAAPQNLIKIVRVSVLL